MRLFSNVPSHLVDMDSFWRHSIACGLAARQLAAHRREANVERFFAEITRKRIRRGAFASVAELEAAIEDYLLRHNADPKPFVWTKAAEVILKKERRALDALNTVRGNQVSESEH